MATENQLTSGGILEFGLFRLDAEEKTLTREGVPVPLTPKAFDLLALLLRHSGHLVRKDELLKEVWRGAFVEEGSLAVNVFALRKALGQCSPGIEYIQTVPRQGYRFVAQVTSLPRANAEPGLCTSPSNEVRTEGPAAIIVLPMQNLTGDAGVDYIGDGFTEAMISRFACFDPRELSVIARTSSMACGHARKTIREIASELRIDYAVESSLRVSDDRIKVTVQLIRADRQTHLWTRDYDRERKDLWATQSEIADAVADEIGVRVSLRQREQMLAVTAVDPAVYEVYLKGQLLLQPENGRRNAQSNRIFRAGPPPESRIRACTFRTGSVLGI